ncbi:MAG: aminotransferase class I/II-fold pyridoxal phosphate-dependent enzyme [Saprospiraceae bacterium]|nr:aminotransferase class I/II-fold pyridoxal phosphate-dependent enzyme [Saprospiraceae bacterium]
MDIFERIRNNMGPLGQYADIAEGYYVFPKLTGEIGSRMNFNGKEVICWSINNYLGLANHPEVRKVDADASAEWGLAYPMGARLMTGETDQHLQLEKELAEYVHKEAGCLLNYGYQGMVSCIDSLVSRRDVILYDAEGHGCIIDGVRLHMGKRIAFEHNNIESFEKQLIRATKMAEEGGGAVLVISEGVFGMRGDQGKLKEIASFKEKYKFRFLVDDAHGLGTLGPNGEGAGVEQGVQDDIDIYFGTFAKSFASIGAFLAGPPDIIRFLKYNMRSQIFAKSLPMPLVIGGLKRLELIRNHPEFKQKLWKIVNALQNGLKEAGFDIGITNTPVTPVFLKGHPFEASQLVHDLRENYRVFCSMVMYPMIPKGEIILRVIPTAAHSLEDVQITLEAFKAVSAKLKNGEYKAEVHNPVMEKEGVV